MRVDGCTHSVLQKLGIGIALVVVGAHNQCYGSEG